MQNKDELIALIKYMAKHNADHNIELKELAEKCKEFDGAYDNLLKAISTFSDGNKFLENALKELEK